MSFTYWQHGVSVGLRERDPTARLTGAAGQASFSLIIAQLWRWARVHHAVRLLTSARHSRWRLEVASGEHRAFTGSIWLIPAQRTPALRAVHLYLRYWCRQAVRDKCGRSACTSGAAQVRPPQPSRGYAAGTRLSYDQWQEQLVITRALRDRNLDAVCACQSLAVGHRQCDRMSSRRKGSLPAVDRCPALRPGWIPQLKALLPSEPSSRSAPLPSRMMGGPGVNAAPEDGDRMVARGALLPTVNGLLDVSSAEWKPSDTRTLIRPLAPVGAGQG